jgi:NADH-quinone oxidoreductase subunit F
MTTVDIKATGRLSQIHGAKCWPAVDKISPCEHACPLKTDVPNYIMAVALGKFEEALQVIRETNPFPSVCGYVCHQPCEAMCNRALVDDPVAIRSIKRFVADYAATTGMRPERAKRTMPGKIAVVGSGPAGLTAAYVLVRKGYGVTVYEASATPGGWLTNGIPDFILPKKAAEADIRHIKDCGVDVRTNVRIGTDITLGNLWERGYKAILLASGAQLASTLDIPGVELRNVLSAVDLLRETKRGERMIFHGRVLVIGGGAVAMDAARTALRLGARDLHVACLESRDNMPAWSWEITAAEKEGVKIHASLAPQAFGISAGSNKIVAQFKRVASTIVDAEGRISWTLLDGPGSDYKMDADYIVVAIGQAIDTSYVKNNGIGVNSRGAFVVDEGLQTGVPGIFAAGDAINVRGTVTVAIALGQQAALRIDDYLSGSATASKVVACDVVNIDARATSPWLTRKARWSMPTLSPQDSVRTFSPVCLGLTQEQAVEEARRCLNCRMCVNCIYGKGQICYETAMRLLK